MPQDTLVRSPLLAALQRRAEAPFGLLFLEVMVAGVPPLDKALTTQTNEEASNDGPSRLDPLYDEDEDEDEALPERYEVR